MRENCTCSLSGGRRPARTCADAPPPTRLKVAGRWGYVYRAINEQGQVIEVLFQEQRDTTAATAFFRSALVNTGVTPHTVTTDKAAAYPPALVAVLRRSNTSPAKPCSSESSGTTSIGKRDSKCFAAARRRAERSDSVELMVLSGISAKAFTGSGRSHRRQTMRCNRKWPAPGRRSRPSC